MQRAPISISLGLRTLAASFLTVALVAATLVLDGPRPASAEHPAECEVIDLGGLVGDAALTADGSWTTEDCDSRVRLDSDAVTYQFSVAEAGRVRLELSSADADPFLFLMAADGSRITHNDDGGRGLDSRIEHDLAPGVYLVEATTAGGRARGGGDFTLTVSYVDGCEINDLGALASGTDLTATGSWSLDACGSRIVAEHPAYGYSFVLAEAGLVRIDLVSENGDPVLSLASPTLGVIGANDDGGGAYNARIEQFLQPGLYLIEATTYRERDLQPFEADFELIVSLVDEQARQGEFQLKIEDALIPDVVIAGQPFDVHYRVGNLGGGDLADAGGRATVYVVGRRVFERTAWVPGSGERWEGGVSYHSGAETATATSVAVPELHPLTATFNVPGPAWLFTAVLVRDEDDKEIGWHGVWHDLTVLSGPTFDAVRVRVDGDDYWVATETDEDSIVSVIAVPTASPVYEVEGPPRGKVIYTAGTLALTLGDIFERPSIAALGDAPATPHAADVTPVELSNPSSTTLLAAFGRHYVDALRASGIEEAVAAGNVITSGDVDGIVASAAEAAAAQYAPIAASWTEVIAGLDRWGTLTFEQAFTVQSQLAYAEAIASPLVTAGRAVEAEAEGPGARAVAGELFAQASCDRPALLAGALGAAGVEDIAPILALDAELRAVQPIYGLATDAALCAIGGIDAQNQQFLGSLGIARSEVAALIGPALPTEPEPEPEPVQLRVIARLAEDGRIEHGVELATGQQVLPERRYFVADADDRRWFETTDIEVGGGSIGIVRARWAADGRIEFGFVDAGGNTIAPEQRYLPADLPPGEWLRSSVFEVPPPAPGELPDQ